MRLRRPGHRHRRQQRSAAAATPSLAARAGGSGPQLQNKYSGEAVALVLEIQSEPRYCSSAPLLSAASLALCLSPCNLHNSTVQVLKELARGHVLERETDRGSASLRIL